MILPMSGRLSASQGTGAFSWSRCNWQMDCTARCTLQPWPPMNGSICLPRHHAQCQVRERQGVGQDHEDQRDRGARHHRRWPDRLLCRLSDRLEPDERDDGKRCSERQFAGIEVQYCETRLVPPESGAERDQEADEDEGGLAVMSIAAATALSCVDSRTPDTLTTYRNTIMPEISITIQGTWLRCGKKWLTYPAEL